MKFTDVYERLPSLYIRLVHSKKQLRRALRHLGMNDEITDADATTFYKEGDATFIVYMNKKALHHDAAEDVGLLAHEATHVAQGYFRAIGEEFPGDEFYAYTVQAVTQELCLSHFEWKKRQIAKNF